MSKTEQVNFRVTQTQLKRLNLAAKLTNRKKAEILNEGLNIRAAIPDDVWLQIEEFAGNFQLPPETVILHIILQRVAFDYAWAKVFGSGQPGIAKQFRFDEKGLVTRERLLKLLIAEYTENLKSVKEKFIKADELEKAGKEVPKNMDFLLSPAEMNLFMDGV